MEAAGVCTEKFKLGLQTYEVAYIVHPKCENTRMPKILAYKMNKVVIHQNVVVWDQIYKNHRGSNFAMQEDFASLAKFR